MSPDSSGMSILAKGHAPMQRQSAEWVVIRRRAPRRALIRLMGYATLAAVVVIITWLLFVTEPDSLANGQPNPAASAPTFAGLVACVGVGIAVIPVIRPPQLAVNHFGLAVRPGAFRTVLLPWVHVDEVAAMAVPGRRTSDAYLLLACDAHIGRHSGDRPRFLDRAVLREANRATEGRAASFDMALRLADFRQSPADLLRQVAGFAPPHVTVADQLD